MALFKKDSVVSHVNSSSAVNDKSSVNSSSGSTDSGTTKTKVISSDSLGFKIVKECPLCKGQNGSIEDVHSTVPFCPVCMEKLRELIGLRK
jgi:hypothetical protein